MSEPASSVHVVFSADAQPSPRHCLQRAQQAQIVATATCEDCGVMSTLDQVVVTDTGFLCVRCESERELREVLAASVRRAIATGPLLVGITVIGAGVLAVLLAAAGTAPLLTGGWLSTLAATALFGSGVVVGLGGLAQLWRATRLSRSEVPVKASLRRLALVSGALSALVGLLWVGAGALGAVLPVVI